MTAVPAAPFQWKGAAVLNAALYIRNRVLRIVTVAFYDDVFVIVDIMALATSCCIVAWAGQYTVTDRFRDVWPIVVSVTAQARRTIPQVAGPLLVTADSQVLPCISPPGCRAPIAPDFFCWRLPPPANPIVTRVRSTHPPLTIPLHLLPAPW